MEQQQRDKSDKTILRILTGMFIFIAIAGLIGLVYASIAANSLEELIGGVVKLGLIVIVLAGIGVVLFKVFGVTWLALLTENHRHIEDMTGKGYLPNNGRYKDMREIARPEPLQIQAPPPQVDQRHALLVSLCLMN